MKALRHLLMVVFHVAATCALLAVAFSVGWSVSWVFRLYVLNWLKHWAGR